MTDYERGRRSVGERLTALEIEARNDRKAVNAYIETSTQLHRDNRQLIDALDKRMDQADLRWARLIAVVGVVVFIANIVGPVIGDTIARALGQ